MEPTTFFFAGKAAPGYVNAKLIIKLINNIAKTVNEDPQTNKLLQVFFLPNYRVTMAERIIPATNLSEQISTAGTEASGTGNMKFMINGALTIGTLDGANIEMAQEAGRENLFIFGHTEEEIEALRPTYRPMEWVNKDEVIKEAVNLLLSGFFNINEPNIFEPLRKSLFEQGDRYFTFADLAMYRDEHKAASELYHQDKKTWNEKAILNIASSAKFSSDRTITEYATEIWHLDKCPVQKDIHNETALTNAKNLR
jgi:starch phosphorylase